MIPTLEQVLAAAGVDPRQQPGLTLLGMLRQREDAIKDALMMFGVTFGLHAEFVAEVLANADPPLTLGTTPSDEERALIHSNFVRHIEELRRQQGEQ